MNDYVASNELNVELYKLSGWETNEDNIHGPMNCPEYSLGYLLRKLPLTIDNDGMHQTLQIMPSYERYDNGDALYKFRYITNDDKRVHVYSFQQTDTPEDAATKLCIELFKNGVLNKEQTA